MRESDRSADEMRECARLASLSAAESLEDSALIHLRTAEVHEKAADYAGIDAFRSSDAVQRHREAAQRHRESAEQDRAMAAQLRRRAKTE